MLNSAIDKTKTIVAGYTSQVKDSFLIMLSIIHFATLQTTVLPFLAVCRGVADKLAELMLGEKL